MNLSVLLAERAKAGKPVRTGIIGAGKFCTMFLAQARVTPGIHVAAVADSDPELGPTALALAQWPPIKAVARSLRDALDGGGTWVTTDPLALLEQNGLDVIIEASGNPTRAVRNALLALDRKCHVIMVNLSADCLAGPLLATRAAERGLVYSLAYGDAPALICELVDWAVACGFEVAAAGKGARWLPGHETITPETVWQHWGTTQERARAGGLNPRVYTKFMDGTRASLELASVCNSTGLCPPAGGLAFPPCGAHDLPRILKPSWDGGRLDDMGRVEVVSSLERDGRAVVNDLRWGVYVTYRTPADYSSHCFAELGLLTDDTAAYAARWRPHQMAGMELGISVASVALRHNPTGSPRAFIADVAAVAKKDMPAGTALDGGGGFTVWGKLESAETAVTQDHLPIGLTQGAVLVRPVAAGQPLTWADVRLPAEDQPVADLRRGMGNSLRR